MNKYLYVAVILLLPLFLSAQGKKLKKYGIVNPVAPVGIKVGSKAPTFKGIDQNGYLIDSKSMLKNAPVVLIFYRGYWCPYCSKALKTYADSINQVTDKGVWFIAVTPETTEGVAKTIDETNLKFSVLSDKDGKIMQAFDVAFNVTDNYITKIKRFKRVSIAENNDQQKAILPVPATYIIDKSGTVVYRHFEYDYKKRASIGAILANLPK